MSQPLWMLLIALCFVVYCEWLLLRQKKLHAEFKADNDRFLERFKELAEQDFP